MIKAVGRIPPERAVWYARAGVPTARTHPADSRY
jgi:hypothetical protein